MRWDEKWRRDAIDAVRGIVVINSNLIRPTLCIASLAEVYKALLPIRHNVCSPFYSAYVFPGWIIGPNWVAHTLPYNLVSTSGLSLSFQFSIN